MCFIVLRLSFVVINVSIMPLNTLNNNRDATLPLFKGIPIFSTPA